MPRFFIRQDQIEGDTVHIYGDDAHHISRSLRMACGEEITVCDMQGIEYRCELKQFLDGEVTADILSQRCSENEPPCFVKLFQALPKGDKLDSIIQKAVECGVGEIIPFESERCVVRMKPEAEDKKQSRRRRIAEEAAKQCGRSVIPDVRATVSFSDVLREGSGCDLCLFCYEGDGTEPLGRILDGARELIKHTDKKLSISIVIGSEGGFSLSEAEKAKNCGFLMTGLGKRILRTETASGFVLSAIACFTELF